jgi:hypothetical protein
MSFRTFQNVAAYKQISPDESLHSTCILYTGGVNSRRLQYLRYVVRMEENKQKFLKEGPQKKKESNNKRKRGKSCKWIQLAQCTI